MIIILGRQVDWIVRDIGCIGKTQNNGQTFKNKACIECSPFKRSSERLASDVHTVH